MKKAFGWNLVLAVLLFFVAGGLLGTIASLGPDICAAKYGAPAESAVVVVATARRALRQQGGQQSDYDACLAPYAVLSYLSGPVALGFVLFCGYMRHRMRERYNIDGNTFNDFAFWVLCCWQCALCQESRTLAQVDDNGNWPEGKGLAAPEQQPLMKM